MPSRSISGIGWFCLAVFLLLAAAVVLALDSVEFPPEGGRQSQIVASCYQLPDGNVVCDR